MNKIVLQLGSISIVIFILAQLSFFIIPYPSYTRALLVSIAGTLLFFIPLLRKKTAVHPLLGGSVILITAFISNYLFFDNVIEAQTVTSLLVHVLIIILAYFMIRTYFENKKKKQAL